MLPPLGRPREDGGSFRRAATSLSLMAMVLDTITRQTDDTVALFDRALGRMFRRAETCERDALLRDTRAINDKVRLLARLGTALTGAQENGADLQEAVASAIGWDNCPQRRRGTTSGAPEQNRPAGPGRALGRCCIG